LKIPMRLFGSFKPTEWTEEAYITRPPFAMETISGRVYLVPRDYHVEETLDAVSSPLGLKKASQERRRFLVTKANAAKALREFDWYVRRSWQNKELTALWALAYIGEREDWSQTSLKLQYVAEVAGLTTKECGQALQNLFHLTPQNGSTKNLTESGTDKSLVQQTLEKKITELPIWTEEKVMSALCTGPGGSVTELYEAVLSQGLTIGAVYKVSERLKIQGYVYTQKHYRVNERGPMREMLTPDCCNCFFGYSNSAKCLEGTLREIEDVLVRDYGKEPTKDERSVIFNAVKSIPYACRTNRRVLSSLRLMHELDGIAGEGTVSTMLAKISDGYGVKFPVRIENSSQ
jgi:hypothetical protein